MVSDRMVREAFVDLADTLARGYDVNDFLNKLCEYCIGVLAVQAGGVLLADARGQVGVAAASAAPGMRALELFEMQQDEGPCADAYRRGEQIVVEDLGKDRDRWPNFTPRALDAGFRAVVACPLRLRDQVIGALNLFRASPGPFDTDDVATAQALADVAAIGVLQERAVAGAEARAEHLQRALTSRVLIEQAKGVVAESLGTDMAGAFECLRGYSRAHNRRLKDVAQAVIDGGLEPTDLKSAG